MLRAAPHARTELASAAGWDANSVVNVTPLWNPHGKGGVYDANSLGVWYTGSAWSIFHQNFQAMAANAGFVVTNSKPGSAAFVHRAQAALPQWTMGFARRTCPGVLQRALDLLSQSPGLQRVRARWRPGIVATAIL